MPICERPKRRAVGSKDLENGDSATALDGN